MPHASFSLYVYEVLEPMLVMFSQNDTIALECASPDTEESRFDLTSPYHSLNMSNLSPEDSGVYRCLSKQLRSQCVSRSFRLLYNHPFRVSTFYKVYSSPMGLMLVGVLIIILGLRIIRGWQSGLLYEVRMSNNQSMHKSRVDMVLMVMIMMV